MRLLRKTLLASLLTLVAGSLSRKLVDDVVFELGSTRPEGIHTLTAAQALEIGLPEDPHLLVTELAYGGIKAVNLETQEVRQIVPIDSFGSRYGVALHYSNGYIIMTTAAGEVFYIIDGSTGEIVATCAPAEAMFPMDIAIIDGVAYVSDAEVNVLWTLDLSTIATSGGICEVGSIPLPGESFSPPSESYFMANGMAEYGNGFFISITTPGAICYFDLDSMTAREVMPPGSVPSAFGMAVATDEDGTKLYVVQNDLWQISVFDISDGGALELLGYIQSVNYDHPARAAILEDYIYTPNTRLYSLPLPTEGEEDPGTFNETFTVAGVDRFSYTMEPLLYPNDPPSEFPVTGAAAETSNVFRIDAIACFIVAGAAATFLV